MAGKLSLSFGRTILEKTTGFVCHTRWNINPKFHGNCLLLYAINIVLGVNKKQPFFIKKKLFIYIYILSKTQSCKILDTTLTICRISAFYVLKVVIYFSDIGISYIFYKTKNQ